MKTEWIPVSTPPILKEGLYGWPSSDVVLCYCKDKTMKTATFEQVDEDCQPVWFTACSERWKCTGEVLYWQALPAAPQ